MDPVEAQAPDLRDYLRLLRRRGWILLLCVIVLPAATYQYTESLPKVFESSTVLQVQSSSVDPSLVPGLDFTPPQQNIQAVARFVSTSAVADEAARRLGRRRGSLLGAAQAIADPDTGFITITATAATARGSADVANAFAAALTATREERGRERIESAIERIRADLRQTPRTDVSTRSQLTLQLQRLEALRDVQSQNVQVLERALPGAQIAPHPRRNAIVALILALMLGAGLIILAERMDRRFHKTEDLERMTGVPVLATIPHDAFPGGRPLPYVREAFQTLRDSLTYFNADEPLTSLIVASALKGEGKTTVATNLAVSYASAGKRVILVDADLRKPDAAQRLGLEDDAGGLSQLLVGSLRLESALREVHPFGRGLRVLPAGPVPPNPSALLGSFRMASLIEELEDDADLVILDTTPLLVVSDAYPLLDKVSGMVALARLDKSPRDAIRKMFQITVTAGGRVLGVVATGAKPAVRGDYGYGYGYGYGDGPKIPPEAETEVALAAAADARPAETVPAAPRGATPEPAVAERGQPSAGGNGGLADQRSDGQPPSGAPAEPGSAVPKRRLGRSRAARRLFRGG